MTVRLETTIKRYAGDTADTKPTSVPVGSTYLDRQTGALWVCYDGTNWAQWDKLLSLVNLERAEDTAHASGHKGLMLLAVRNDTLAPLAGTDADYIPFTTDALGQLYARLGRGDAVVTVTIANAASLSGAADTRGYAAAGIVIPSDWVTATSITFQGSPDNSNWFNLYDDSGTEVVATVAASRAVSFDVIAGAVAPWRYLKVRSGTSAAAVNQTDADGVSLSLVLKS